MRFGRISLARLGPARSNGARQGAPFAPAPLGRGGGPLVLADVLLGLLADEAPGKRP
jgi:hypothetical protein